MNIKPAQGSKKRPREEIKKNDLVMILARDCSSSVSDYFTLVDISRLRAIRKGRIKKCK